MPSRSASGDRARRPSLKNPHGVGGRSRRSDAASAAEDRVSVGRILRPHGIRGELKVEVWSDVEGRFAAGTELYLKIQGHSRRVRVQQARPERGHLLVRLQGVDSRDLAEELRGGQFEVDSSEVPEPPEGFYYHYQLVGCSCHDERSGWLGEVAEVVEDGGGILLRVEKEGRSVLVPFVDAFLAEVDIETQRIDTRLPEGLIKVCTSKS